MELPSLKELELEGLVRQRDSQLSQLNDEVTRLRQYLVNQPSSQKTDSVTLPPALISILLPHIDSASKDKSSSSSTVTSALTQRARLMQEENDELYEILKHKETGRLKEEVRGLRRVVDKLEGGLRESHQVISALSTELDKTYEALMCSSKQVNSSPNIKHLSRSPRNSYHPPSHSHSTSHGNGTSRPPPTGPRAFKKPRLSESHSSPPPRSHALLPHTKPQNNSGSSNTTNSSNRPGDLRDHLRYSANKSVKSNRITMEVDGDDNKERERETSSPVGDRERDRIRERDPEKDRNRDRERGIKDRDRDRTRDRDRDGNRASVSRRNGGFLGNPGRGGAGGVGGSGAGPGRRNHNDRKSATPSTVGHGVDRTLAERLGL